MEDGRQGNEKKKRENYDKKGWEGENVPDTLWGSRKQRHVEEVISA